MLVLQRKLYQSVRIGHDITITVVRTGPGSVHLGIEAPKTVAIARTELLQPEGSAKRKAKDS